MELTSHKHPDYDNGLTVCAVDDPGNGGARHNYVVTWEEQPGYHPVPNFVTINFQNGPVSEVGHNGLLEGQLVSIMIDRYEAFQAGPYPSPEAEYILASLRQIEDLIHKRVTDRLTRGVMGKLEK